MAELTNEEILTVYEIAPARSKTGRMYHSAKTSKGNMTIFEDDIQQKVAANLNKTIQVEVATSEKGFKNIRKFLSVISSEQIPAMPEPKKVFTADVQISNREQAMYVSYAKDIYIAYLEHSKGDFSDTDLAQLCISIVNRFKEAFK